MTATIHSTPDWHGKLCQTLTHLRERWPHDWPGLPVVLSACIAQRWPMAAPASADAVAMLNAAKAMAQHMESIALSTSYEPHYHNRLHTADALVSVCWLTHALQHEGHDVPDDWMACLLLAVTSHDVLHPGGANRYLQEFEQQSVRLLRGMTAVHGVPDTWTEMVSHLILHTDPSLVPDNHHQVAQRSFMFDPDWAVVLMNEADILASATAEFGPGLGHALAHEWQTRQHPLHSVVGTDAGRLQFLSSLRFSTPASLALNMPSEVARQITQLQGQRSVND